jgi:hypothetical protein
MQNPVELMLQYRGVPWEGDFIKGANNFGPIRQHFALNRHLLPASLYRE